MNDLKKNVANQRTGANIIGINIDTLPLTTLTPDFQTVFNHIENFAKKTDAVNIKNEQEMFQANLQARQIEFQKKYLGKNVYSNDKEYTTMIDDFNKLKIQAEQDILAFKYLNGTERKQALLDYRNDFEKQYLGILNKRNEAVIKGTIDKTQLLIDTKISNLKNTDLNDVGAISKGIKSISKDYDKLVELGIFNEYEKSMNLAKNIADVESEIISQKLNQDIIYGDKYPTIQSKKDAIMEIKKQLDSDDRMNALIDGSIKEYKLTNDENVREYLKSKLREGYNRISFGLEKNLYNYDKAQTRLQNQMKKNYIKENSIRNAINSNDTFKLTEFKTGTVYNTSNMLSDDYNINELYGTTIEELGNKSDWRVGKVIDKNTISEIRDYKSSLDKTNSNYDGNTLNAIYAIADKYSGGDIDKKNMILKNAALELNQNPTVVLNYQNNPDYLKVAGYLKKGNNLSLGAIADEDGNLEAGIRKILDRKSEKRYLELFEELGGDDRAYNVLNNYIAGYIKTEQESYKRTLEKLPVTAFENVLKKDDMFDEIKKNIDILYDLEIAPIKYEYAPIISKNYGIEELIFSNETDDNIPEEDDIYNF